MYFTFVKKIIDYGITYNTYIGRQSLVYWIQMFTNCAFSGVTTACFEPSLDYCVVKIPRYDEVKGFILSFLQNTTKIFWCVFISAKWCNKSKKFVVILYSIKTMFLFMPENCKI